MPQPDGAGHDVGVEHCVDVGEESSPSTSSPAFEPRKPARD